MKRGSIRLRQIKKLHYFSSSSSNNNNNKTMLIVMLLIAISSDLSALADDHHGELKGGGRGLKEAVENTTGTTAFTFDCSPSGPCIPCVYHEKKLESYRCSETGYRIPMKCVKTTVSPLDTQNNNHDHQGRPSLLEDSSSTVEVGSEVYITYRSCIPAVNQERLSLLGFEAIMLLLLASSSFVIFRRKRTLIMPPRF
uniref:uncharacterized protein LOC122581096 n=1 Tax=Erigeron canadensis TaxID=72917 RepID=UPI001CB8C7EF|nr:uncharacterized protein LOC122581096 [Erigeron canadensis]